MPDAVRLNFIDIKRQYENYRRDIDGHIQEVLEEAAFIMGKQVGLLEAQLAGYVGAGQAVSCANGTDALQLVLMAYGIKPGDEIITTPFTFIATTEVMSLLGAKPVFVDIRRDTFNIDPQKIAASITPRTRAIIAVDIFGQSADYDEIHKIAREHGLLVIEDAAQSFGAMYKGKMTCNLTDVACTSFFPAKPLGCFGDGGMIFLNDAAKAETLRSLRAHGCGSHKYEHVRVGINSRLDTLQAGILLAKFKHFPSEVEARGRIAAYYSEHLKAAVEVPTVLPFNRSVYAQYNIVVKNRLDLQKKLAEEGIPTAVYYPKPLHLQSVYTCLGHQKGDFPVSEEVSDHIVAIPMHPFLTHQEQDYIIEHIKRQVS